MISEADLLQRTIDLAKLTGWRVHHARPARTAKGWRTPTQGHVGLPDLILARGGVVIMAELKGPRGKVTPEQREWLDACGDHGRLWRPEHWSEIVEELG